ncbi:MAG: hypothetical protein AAF206_08775 [Bacteroidota bacterium]
MPINKQSYDNLVRELYYRDLRWTAGVDKDELAQQQLIDYLRQQEQEKNRPQARIKRALVRFFAG